MDMLKIARESGLAVVLDGKIGREEYTSVSGSISALLRFGEAVRAASLREHRRFRLSYQIGDRTMTSRKNPRTAFRLALPESSNAHKCHESQGARAFTFAYSTSLCATDIIAPTPVATENDRSFEWHVSFTSPRLGEPSAPVCSSVCTCD